MYFTFQWGPQSYRNVKKCLKKYFNPYFIRQQILLAQKGKRKVQGVPQSQTAALPRSKEEEESDKSKQAQTEQTCEKH